MSKNGVTNILIAGFPNHAGYPYHDLRLIVEVLSQVAADHGLQCSSMALSVRDTFGVRPASYHLRIGEKVRAPYIPAGEGDVLLGLEAGTAARCAAEYMGGHGTAIVNTWQYHPPFQVKYPTVQELVGLLKGLLKQVISVDLVALVKEVAGDRKLAQGVMECIVLGAASGAKLLPFPAQDIESGLASLCATEQRDRLVVGFRVGTQFTAA
ncbi:MAG: 2-oxoacid:acceptor oxidoreductase family protein [Deltaproteobacteria bacterium]|nr:2-oxoacid:acceptor oxidoreductase family protein [Deltaproteobacteria bacterium]